MAWHDHNLHSALAATTSMLAAVVGRVERDCVTYVWGWGGRGRGERPLGVVGRLVVRP